MYDKYANFFFKSIGFLYWSYIILMVILALSPAITSSSLDLFLPNEVVSIIPTENINKILAGFLLSLFFVPYLWRKGIKFNFMGQPKYKEFSFKRFFLMVVVSPLILGLTIEILYPDFSYISALIKFIEYSNNIISFILTYININYLKSVLPLIPIAIISFFLIKYLMYYVIIFLIKYIWFIYMFISSFNSIN